MDADDAMISIKYCLFVVNGQHFMPWHWCCLASLLYNPTINCLSCTCLHETPCNNPNWVWNMFLPKFSVCRGPAVARRVSVRLRAGNEPSRRIEVSQLRLLGPSLDWKHIIAHSHLRQNAKHALTHDNLTWNWVAGAKIIGVGWVAKVRFQLYCERRRKRYHYSVETVMWDPGG